LPLSSLRLFVVQVARSGVSRQQRPADPRHRASIPASSRSRDHLHPVSWRSPQGLRASKKDGRIISKSDSVRRIRNDAFEKAAPELAEHAQAIRSLGKRVLSDTLEIGSRLAKARPLIGHGHWLAWLKTEFGWSDERARRFINVFELAKFHTVLDLDLSLGALYVLGAPSTSKEIREEIVARCKEGESFSPAGVQRVVSEARAVNVPVTGSVVKLNVPVYVTRAEDGGAGVDTPALLREPILLVNTCSVSIV
jgi:hypothetical protein